MAEQVYLTVYTDVEVVRELDTWAAEERRSRNNLVQLIIAEALDQWREKRERQAAKPSAMPRDVVAEAEA
jgi:hypothetical protein